MMGPPIADHYIRTFSKMPSDPDEQLDETWQRPREEDYPTPVLIRRKRAGPTMGWYDDDLALALRDLDGTLGKHILVVPTTHRMLILWLFDSCGPFYKATHSITGGDITPTVMEAWALHEAAADLRIAGGYVAKAQITSESPEAELFETSRIAGYLDWEMVDIRTAQLDPQHTLLRYAYRLRAFGDYFERLLPAIMNYWPGTRLINAAGLPVSDLLEAGNDLPAAIDVEAADPYMPDIKRNLLWAMQNGKGRVQIDVDDGKPSYLHTTHSTPAGKNTTREQRQTSRGSR
jgi:hypothetical protein